MRIVNPEKLKKIIENFKKNQKQPTMEQMEIMNMVEENKNVFPNFLDFAYLKFWPLPEKDVQRPICNKIFKIPSKPRVGITYAMNSEKKFVGIRRNSLCIVNKVLQKTLFSDILKIMSQF